MFGVPAKEGVKRWANLKTKKIIKQLLNTSIISLTFGFYSYASMAVGACVGGLIGMKFFGKDTPQFTFMFVTSMTCALNGLLLISKPMEVMSDTLFLGFAEAPLRLEVGAKEVYDLFGDDTKRILDHDIKEAKGEKEEGCCDGCCGSGDDGCCCNIC
ncbi:XYPPX repeat family protein [Histomonas meleagridis]|uniref:XYPPX repeat family protein n=1 Tax=Histomonas meleagridis TaxID=135588 RepID=UPI003559FEF6|nr:XYPPX repeat family protein [Histomonas meleagridis]KAH0806921.1 XYPPX repeat family protein [Histomonas meleagridis]